MKSPTVSVIITTHNRPALLKKAIQSVLNQDYANFELLIIDDASSGTETAHIIAQFPDRRIRCIKNASQLGSTNSLNIGIKESKGKYIAILDDDDEWIIKDKLSKQTVFLETHPHHVLVSTNVIVTHYDTDVLLVKSNAPRLDEKIRNILLFSNPIAHSAVLYRKDAAISVGGYDPSFPRGKDYDLWLKLGIKGKIEILPDYAVRYRESTSVQRNIIEIRLKDTQAKILVIRRHQNFYRRASFSLAREYIRLLIFRTLYLFTRSFWKRLV